MAENWRVTMSRPDFPRPYTILTPGIINRIRQNQEYYDRDPEQYEQRQKEQYEFNEMQNL